MVRFAIVSTCVLALLAGCGEVIVFGHVVRERPASESQAEATSAGAGGTVATSATAASGTAATPRTAVEPGATAAPGAAVEPGATAASGAAAESSATAAASTATTPASKGRTSEAPASQSATSSAPGSAASVASTAAGSATPAASPHTVHVVKAVDIVVTPEATAKVTGDASRFTADALLDAIKTELKSRKLLDEQDPRASGTAEIVVDGLATRPTTNAILFGYKMLAGTLEGDIRVTGASDTDSTGSRIVAESRLTVSASGDDKNPLAPLYRRFAVLAADHLAGIVSEPHDATQNTRF